LFDSIFLNYIRPNKMKNFNQIHHHHFYAAQVSVGADAIL
jgi:hypothetical protein